MIAIPRWSLALALGVHQAPCEPSRHSLVAPLALTHLAQRWCTTRIQSGVALSTAVRILHSGRTEGGSLQHYRSDTHRRRVPTRHLWGRRQSRRFPAWPPGGFAVQVPPGVVCDCGGRCACDADQNLDFVILVFKTLPTTLILTLRFQEMVTPRVWSVTAVQVCLRR
jgi:hypothetical protein